MIRSRNLLLYFDYVEPTSYLLELRLRRMGFHEGAGLTLVPFEIRIPGLPLLDPNDERWADHWRAAMLLGKDLNISLTSPWIVPSTRKAHELAIHARGNGCFPQIHDALFRAYLQEGRDIGRIDILVEIAKNVGLEPMEAKAVLGVDRFSSTVEKERADAVARGIEGVPTLYSNTQSLSGYPDERSLENFMNDGLRPEDY